MSRANKLFLIGIGYRPLGQRAKEAVVQAGVLLASSRLLEVFKRYEEYETVKDRIQVFDRVPDTISFIQKEFHAKTTESRTVALLASGDPFFFGIGRRVIDEFGGDTVTVLPDLSSMQVAFARINAPWDDAFCISVHGGPDIAKRRALPYEMNDIPHLLDRRGKLAVLTDKQNNPAEIARVVRSAHGGPGAGTVMHVCQKLGYPDERIWTGTVHEAADMTFAEPNVVVLTKIRDRGRMGEMLFGLREDEIEHDRGMITKDEVRAVTLHKLRMAPDAVLWDIGAGSGSLSIEAARLSPDIRVFAVEKETHRVETMRQNVLRFRTKNVKIVPGPAPEALEGLPAPERVFIGGSAGALDRIMDFVGERMRQGIVVVNAASLDTLRDGEMLLEQRGFVTDVTEVSVSRSKAVGGKKLLNAMNPVFIVRGERR